MRGQRSHGTRIQALLKGIEHDRVAVKVNTVVAKPNLDEIKVVGAEVRSSRARIWSLYQFWPIGDAASRNRATFFIGDDEYASVVADMREEFPDLVIEGGSVEARRNAYFFVNPMGRAYTIDQADSANYVELGNLLVDPEGVLRAWNLHANPQAIEIDSKSVFAQ